MTYTVWYKKIGSWKWSKINNVKGDHTFFVKFRNGDKDGIKEVPYKSFRLEDESVIEVPMDGVVFQYAPPRHALIVKKMEREACQKMVLDT